MSASRTNRSRRSLTFIGTLMLTSALAAPAFAQIEEVVVTAQKRAEDIQNVPIQVSAFSAQDMAAHQITMAKDLVFATPNVNYTKTNFSGDDFTIRGIGNDVITGGGESGVAVDFDNIYLAGASLANSQFYDLQRVEVLEGPQNVLYGRGATAGAVNIIPAKPDLENAFVQVEASYGNYSAMEDKFTVNLPIVTDQLGIRLSGDFDNNDGLVTDDLTNSKIDATHDYSLRGTIRWQPTSGTTIDFMGQFFHKADSGMRSERQQCLYDPSGTLGCLPGGLANEGINENAFFAADIASIQGFSDLGLGDLGIKNLAVQSPEVNNPSQAFHVDSDIQPSWHATDDFLAVNASQRLTSWLDMEVNAGYDHSSTLQEESYNNSAPQLIDQTLLGTYGPGPAFGGTNTGAEANLYDTLEFLSGGTAYPNLYNQFLASHPGELPASGLQGLGLNSGDIKYYSNSFSTFDQSNAEGKQYSVDVEFKSHFDGPLNFMAGAFYLRQEAWGDYYVSSAAQGYASVALGALEGLANPACYSAGCTLAPAFYDNTSPAPGGVTLKSESAYGQGTWQIVPNLLKLEVGARWTEDYKSSTDQIFLVNTVLPVGDSSKSDLGITCYSQSALSSAPAGTGACFQQESWSRITGNASLDYTPKLSFTDQTLIYASYGRGYKAGGFNPGLPTFVQGGVSQNYEPEGIDALEAGTKNLLFNSTLQANVDFWYYNYEGLQVSQILDNDSINVNVNSRMYGSEGQFIYAPDDHWLFDLNIGYDHSRLGNQAFVDPRNPTASAANAVLVKDDTPSATAAQNCAVYLLPGNSTAPGDNTALNTALAAHGLPTYSPPPGGSGVLAGTAGAQGIPNTNYGSCSPAFEAGAESLMEAFGYTFGYSNQTGATALQLGWNKNETAAGVTKSISGNENPNSPPWTIGFGAQYTFNMGNDYTLVPRVDFYWQTQTWGRIFEDPADKINGYTVTNAQIQLNSPDNWYVQAYIKNAFNSTYVTGEYLTSSSSGLYTNEFLGDPRMYGVRVGIKF